MTSERQIAARRQDALRSTGPRIPEVKPRVSRKALRHGSLAHHLLSEADLTGGRAAARTLACTDAYGKLSRHETHIEHGIYRALREIQRLGAARQGRGVEPPRAVEVGLDIGALEK